MPFYKNAFARHRRNVMRKRRMVGGYGSRRKARGVKRHGWSTSYGG